MPSWAQASISETFSIAHRVVLARLEPASASGSIWLRRADMTANSAATKKALPISSTTSQRIPAQSLIASPALPASAQCRTGGRIGHEAIRSIRRPSIRSTSSVPPSTSTVSPTTAIRPSSAMMKPPTVS